MTSGQVHLHSAASDGMIRPEMLVGLDFAALTDHDTFAGLAAFQSAATQIIPGIEVSVIHAGCKFHVVILEPQPALGFFTLLSDLKKQRERKVKAFLEEMSGHGFQLSAFPFCWPGINKRWLLEQLLGDSLNQDQVRRLGLQGPKDFKRRFVPFAVDFTPDGVELGQVRESCGGIFILAHPGASLDLKLPENVARIEDLCQTFSFHGIEALTRRHSGTDAACAAEIARKLDLVAITTNDVHSPDDIWHNRTPQAQLDALYERGNQVRADWSILLHEN